MIGAKLLCIRFDKIVGFIRVHDRAIFFVLFGTEKCDFIYNRIKCLIGVKSVTTNVISHNYEMIKVDSYDLLSVEKA